MKQSFDDLITNLRSVIADFAFYTDFEKVVANVRKQQTRIQRLEEILEKDHFDEDLILAIKREPQMIGLLANLLAIRKNFDVMHNDRIISYDLKSKTLSDQDYVDLVKESGLSNLLREGLVKDLKSYLLGVEVGLDSNARKNRGGTAMEKLVEEYIHQLDIPYYAQVNKRTLKSKFGIDIDIVLNYDLPMEVVEYFKGLALVDERGEGISFVDPDDEAILAAIEQKMKHVMDEVEHEGFLHTKAEQKEIKDKTKKPRHKKVEQRAKRKAEIKSKWVPSDES
jgi:hypothetical protein